MFNKLKEKINDFFDEYGDYVIVGLYAASIGWTAGCIAMGVTYSKQLRDLCDAGASFHADNAKKGIRYLYSFGTEAIQ